MGFGDIFDVMVAIYVAKRNEKYVFKRDLCRKIDM